MIEISNKEKKRRQYKKELKSLRNKMGSNIVWFDSLPKSKQYDILFKWKSEKYIKKSVTIPKLVKLNKRSMNIKIYPSNIKHYILILKKNRRYKPTIVNIRETTIDLILQIK